MNPKLWFVTSVLSAGIACSAAGQIIYVDAKAPYPNNGSSWANAFNYLQDALAVVSSGDEIWVAEGHYTPDSNSTYPSGTGERTATFQLINGVALYGGFPCGGGMWEQRDPNVYETILNGDIAKAGDNLDNSYHVVTGSATDATAVLDGFIITAGNANGTGSNGMGGGVYNKNGSPTLANCTLSANSAESCIGGMFNHASSPTVTNCTFKENRARDGGAMENHWSSPTLINCTLIGNSASCCGGAIYNLNESFPTLIGCKFSGNSAGDDGGGIYNYWCNRTLTITNCTFSANSSVDSVGAVYNYFSGPTLTNCIFSGNSADCGGGICNWVSCPTLTNCTFAGNSAPKGSAVACDSLYSQDCPSTVRVTNCIIWDDGNTMWNGDGSTIAISYSDVQTGWAGIGNIDAGPCFVEEGYWADANDPNIHVEPNEPNAAWVEGDYHLRCTSPCIDAGDNNSVPPDTHDLDCDENTSEYVPYDIDGSTRVADGNDDGYLVVDMGAYEYLAQQIFEVSLDIKPQSCPNPLNVKSKGVLPVVVLGTEAFDVTNIDPESVRLAGVSPIRTGLEDVGAPVVDQQGVCDCTTDGSDGFSDFTLKFDIQEIIAVLGEVDDSDVVQLTITGESFDGTPIKGEDCIVVRSKGHLGRK